MGQLARQLASAARESPRAAPLISAVILWPVLAALLLLAIWGGITSSLESRKAEALDAARERLSSATASYNQQIRRTVELLDQLSLTLKYDWERYSRQPDLGEMAAFGLFPSDSLLLATVVNANGDIVSTSIDTVTRPNLAGQDFFRKLKAGCCKGLLITGPEPALQVDHVVVRFSRALQRDGKFDGVASISVSPAYLTTFALNAVASPGSFISVRYAGGPVIATRVAQSDQSNIFYRQDPVFDTPSGVKTVPGASFRDGQERVVAWRKLDRYPLVTLAAIPVQAALAGLEQTRRERYALGLMLSIALAMATLVAMVFSHRIASRQFREAEVRDSMRLATDAANEGFYSLTPLRNFDGEPSDYIYADCNERGAALLGRTRQEVVGKRVSELVEPQSRAELLRLLNRCLSEGFYEDELRVPPDSPIKAEWVYRRIVVTGQRLVLTLRDITEAKRQESAMARLASTDALTALPNRHWLSVYLPAALKRAQRQQRQLAVLFIDLDNFKNVNDSLGHDAGDELLKAAAQRLKDVVRATDHVVRLGGDEFTVVLEQIETPEHAGRVAQQVIRSMEKPFELRASPVPQKVNASIGIGVFPQDGSDSETVLKNADIAMYAAKAAGKGRFYFYQSHLSDTLLLRLDRERALREAVAQDQFIIHYQPRVGVSSGHLTSVEALVRWQHPERGLVYPSEFIDLAEDTGLIIKLGDLVIAKVCRQLAQWKQDGLSLVPVSVNVSAHQLRAGSVCRSFARCMQEHGVEARWLEVELTESAMIEESSVVANELEQIRRLGIKLMIDDFGTGYSSMSQLHRLDVDVLKVDKGLTQALIGSDEGKKIFGAIVSMAEALDMCVVAEGVETREQLRELQDLHCDEIQGYLISRAVSALDMGKLLMRQLLLRENRAESFIPV